MYEESEDILVENEVTEDLPVVKLPNYGQRTIRRCPVEWIQGPHESSEHGLYQL